jgi:hypothetical protein
MIRAKGISSPGYGQGHLSRFIRGPICRKFARFRTSAYRGHHFGPHSTGGSSTRYGGIDSLTVRSRSSRARAGFPCTFAGFTHARTRFTRAGFTRAGFTRTGFTRAGFTCAGFTCARTVSGSLFVGTPTVSKCSDLPRDVTNPASAQLRDVTTLASAQLRDKFRRKYTRTSTAAVER